MYTTSLDNLLEGLPIEYHEAIKRNNIFEKRGLFLSLNKDEERDYRQWARENYQPEQMIEPTWHPAIVDECVKIIKEFIAD